MKISIESVADAPGDFAVRLRLGRKRHILFCEIGQKGVVLLAAGILGALTDKPVKRANSREYQGD